MKGLSPYRAFLILATFSALAALKAPIHVLRSPDLKLHDLLAMLRPDTAPSEAVLIVSIDDRSLEALGAWPWPESRIAELVRSLAGAKAIGLAFPLPPGPGAPAPGPGPDAPTFDRVVEALRRLPLLQRDPQNPWKTLPPGTTSPVLVEIEKLRPGPRVAGTPAGPPPSGSEPFPQELVSLSVAGRKSHLPGGLEGHLEGRVDTDGTVRTVPMFLKIGSRESPAMALVLARLSQGIPPDQARLEGEGVRLGPKRISLEPGSALRVAWRGPTGSFPTFPAAEVLGGKVPPARVKDKVVLVGLGATGLASTHPTPVDPRLPTVEVAANAVESLLRPRPLTRPPWAEGAEAGLVVLIGLLGALLFPSLGTGRATLLAGLLLGAIATGAVGLFWTQDLWLRAFYPLLLLTLAWLPTTLGPPPPATSPPAAVMEEATPALLDRLMGEAYLRLGMLELASEHLRASPMDESVAELLYQVGQGFEHVGQPSEAATAYGAIGTKFGSYKDIFERLQEIIHHMPAPSGPPADSSSSRVLSVPEEARLMIAPAQKPSSVKEKTLPAVPKRESPPEEPVGKPAAEPPTPPEPQPAKFENSVEEEHKTRIRQFEKTLPIIRGDAEPEPPAASAPPPKT